MKRNIHKGLIGLTIINIVIMIGAVAYYFMHQEEPTVLPEDTDDKQYQEWLDKNHADSLKYSKKRGGYSRDGAWDEGRGYGNNKGGYSHKGYGKGNGNGYGKENGNGYGKGYGNGYGKGYGNKSYGKGYGNKGGRKQPNYGSYEDKSVQPASFAFDPNTADSSQLLALGLSAWQVENIYKYRAKGGRYHRKEDFAKLYGLTGEQWDHLEPLIQIGEKYQYLSDLTEESEHYVKDTVKRVVKYTEGEIVPLNRCDTSALQKVPGIGAAYARRIVSYRDQLGGFVSAAQLNEVFEMPEEVVKEITKWFRVEPNLVRKMNVNTLSLTQLKKHPYINFYQAKVITEHRKLYGPIKSLSDLRLYDEFTPEDIEKLTPYVTY